jgi:hypothetical protein
MKECPYVIYGENCSKYCNVPSLNNKPKEKSYGILVLKNPLCYYDDDYEKCSIFSKETLIEKIK